MTKPNDEIPTTVYAGLTSIDHTPFKQVVGAELDKMAQRLHYNPGTFVLGPGEPLNAGESGGKIVQVWHESVKIEVRVPDDSPAAIAQALEAALKKIDLYKARFEQVDSDTSD